MANQKFNSILVALDYSPYSKKVLAQAIELRKALKVPLTAIHVAPDPMNHVYSQVQEGFSVDIIQERLENFYDLKKKKIKSVVAVGFPARFIIDQAAEMKNPLIVIGYKGRSAVSRFLLGSIAEQVLRNSVCPVWIHRGDKVVKPKNVLVPHDLLPKTDVALATAKLFNGGKSGNIEAYHVCEMPAPVMYYDSWIDSIATLEAIAEEGIKNFVKTHPKIKVTKSNGYPVAQILQREKKFDLIVLNPHSHSELMHSEGQITGKVVRSSRGPVVIVR